MRIFIMFSVLACWLVAPVAVADDWHQWRGKDRNGVALSSPPLASLWSASGPKLAWESQPIAGKGFGSLAIAGGRVYLYVNDQRDEPIASRTVTEQTLRKLGWDRRMPPADILAKVEAERVSRKQRRLRGKDRREWAEQWVEDNLSAEDQKQYRNFIRKRLEEGEFAVALDVYAKLESVRDKKFESVDALEEWFTAQKFDFPLQERISKSIIDSKTQADDRVWCLDAATGKPLWNRKFEASPSDRDASSTPCIVGNQLFVVTTKQVLCLRADTGEPIWQAAIKGNGAPSSFVVHENKAIVLAQQLTAFDVKTGDVIWTQEQVQGNRSSPVIWSHGNRQFVLCGTKKNKIACVDANTGDLKWEVDGGGYATCAIEGDVLVSNSRAKEAGVFAYRLSPDGATKLWQEPIKVEGMVSPVIYEGHVYVVSSEAVCLSLKTGEVVWRGKGGNRISSPLIADGKLFGMLNGTRLVMLDASPKGYQVLSSMRVRGMRCASPGFVDGKLFVRMDKGISCFDLTKQANPSNQGTN